MRNLFMLAACMQASALFALTTTTTTFGKLQCTDLGEIYSEGLYRYISSTVIPESSDIVGAVCITNLVGHSTVKHDVYTIWIDELYATTIGDFSNCKGITSLEVINNGKRAYYYGSVIKTTTFLANAFRGCTSLKRATITSTIQESSRNLFYGCTALEDINHSFTYISEGSFRGCSSLKNIDLSQVTCVGAGAFKSCIGLESVTFGAKLTELVDDAFENCDSLTNIVFNSRPPLGLVESGILANCPKITFPDKYKSEWNCVINDMISTRKTSGEVKVPYAWLKEKYPSLGSFYLEYEQKANETAENGINSIGECYIAGLDPNDSGASFVTIIRIGENGPEITWEPNLGEERKYDILGSNDLVNWSVIGGDDIRYYQFFKVEVEQN